MDPKLMSVIVLLILDFLWIGLFMNNQYKSMIRDVQKTDMKPKLPFAVLSYSLMVIGLLYFVLPNIRKDSVEDCLKYGFLFGIILYGVYDFTAAAVLKDWKMNVALIDILWGGTVYFIASYVYCKTI